MVPSVYRGLLVYLTREGELVWNSILFRFSFCFWERKWISGFL